MTRISLAGVVLAVLALGCSGPPSDQGDVPASPRPSGSSRVVIARANISAEGLDCEPYKQYTAALATFTVDCLGTIAPDTYRVSSSGSLERNFENCTQERSKLADIDALLTIQQRGTELPLIRECLAGHYADFVSRFAESGVGACPVWHKERTVNPITPEVIQSVSPRLGRIVARAALADAADELTIAQAPGLPEELEEKNLYRVEPAPGGSAFESMGVAESAAACAKGFAGFVLETNHDLVLTDPVVWLLGTTYPSAAADPFLRPGYYHPMSHYGAPPGTRFANYARYAPCPSCPPERCSYFAGSHIITRLQADCLDVTDISTCVAYCGPSLPP